MKAHKNGNNCIGIESATIRLLLIIYADNKMYQYSFVCSAFTYTSLRVYL